MNDDLSLDLLTYEDHLEKNGYVSTGVFSCPACSGPPRPSFAFVKTHRDHEHSFICSTCHTNDISKVRAAEETLQLVAREAADPWDCEGGATIRADRSIKIESWLWATDRDTSPLNDAAQERVRVMIRALHRITIDFRCPSDVVWPDEPTITRIDYAKREPVK